jgi:pyruvate dehydrogenase E2 component (dihydrolipoamide acetyltransferase)
VRLGSCDVSVAVAIDDGLLTPVILDAEKKNLKEISLEMKEKSQKAKAKKLLPEEYNGGSCTISNLGMMRVENFDAVINPPQASILAVGSATKKPLVGNNGEIYVGHVMSVTLSVDHRVIDGAVGAEFLSSIVEYLSNPLRLIL